jgi:hypothetical protein
MSAVYAEIRFDSPVEASEAVAHREKVTPRAVTGLVDSARTLSRPKWAWNERTYRKDESFDSVTPAEGETTHAFARGIADQPPTRTVTVVESSRTPMASDSLDVVEMTAC